jgi:predicted nucleic acid-binding protein
VNAAILDTDVLSMLFKGDSRARSYRACLTDRLLGISFMTLAELDCWSLDRNWGTARTAELETQLSEYTILPASRELCSAWDWTIFAPSAVRRIRSRRSAGATKTIINNPNPASA